MSKLNCIVITPSKKIRNVECDYVGATGVEGDFGILPQHAPFITELAPNILFLRNLGRVDDPIGITSGFLHVFEDKVTVVADNAYEMADLTKTRNEYKKLCEEKKLNLNKIDKSDTKYNDAKMEVDKLSVLFKLTSYK